MTKEEILASSDLFLLDLDGTLYLGDRPIGAAKETLARLREMGKKLVYLSNNSSRTEAEYREKLTRIGFFDERDGVFTSATATEGYLLAEHAGKKVFLLGTEALRAEFVARGIPLGEEDPDLLVLAYDVELTFEKLRRFDRFLRLGKPYFATHPDNVCPTEDGSMPDVGSFIELFARSSGRRPDLIVGKPYPLMAEELERRYGVPRSRMCTVGDRMYTDIRFGNRNGIKSVLVLSGETTAETAADFPDLPDLVLPDVNAIF